ncbi:GTP-binding protein [Metabacillus litoralis]|uniref:GTP-binding protein n=1 Tax=Metabacillus litoralis TaxID=152268 RepID=UPI001CFF484C|nr:GTP-binding protein [Metabacillus litoralis]
MATYYQQEQKRLLLEEPDLLQKWDQSYCDRMTDLVMIGIGMNRRIIEESLDHCLLTEEEMEQGWTRFTDPLPLFTVAG